MARSNLFEVVGEIAVRGAQAAESAIASVDKRAESMAGRLDAAGDRMQGFGNRMSDAGDKATLLSGAMVGAGAAVGGYINSVTQSAERTLEMSERLGVNIEFMQEWERVAKRFGIQGEALRDGIKELTLRADEFAQTGKGPAAEAMERLGLSQEEVAKGSEDVEGFFRMVIDRMRNVEDAAARQRIADELFGGQAGEQFTELLNQSSEEIQKTLEDVRSTGGFFSEEDAQQARQFNREIQRTGERLTAVGRAIVIDVLPTIREVLPVVESQVVPALKTAAGAIAGLIEAFGALPGPVQQAVVTLTALTVVVGPLLSIFGRVISVGGSVLKLFARFPGATRAVSGGIKGITTALGALVAPISKGAAMIGTLAGKLTGFMSTAIRPLLALLGRFSAVLGAFWAGWEVGTRIINPIIEMFPRLDRAIENVVGAVAVEFPKMLQSGWNKAKSVLGSMVSGFKSAFTSMAQSAIDKASEMASAVINKAQQMWDAMTRNSIIPDMADEAISAFDRMAESGEDSGERMRRGMVDNMSRVDAPSGARRGGGRGDGPTHVDMSHSTFRDDRDMLERMRRKGADMTGAF